MNDKWLYVTDVEKQTGIPSATIRRYIRNHGHHLQLKKRGKIYLVASESLSFIKNIRDLYDQGKRLEDIEDALRSMNIPMTHDEREMTVNASEVLVQLQKDMEEQKKFNQSLLETIQKQQEYINTKLEERDQKLLQSIREIQEAKREIAVSHEKKKGFFSKFFKGREE
ncbi:DUF3967 domain-containing protein [Bacillus sp. FJAT-49711]|uniref:DUF3967 domain-containing protein n=1 Tax=Bacillus sp. FJAT-49711 TaxID=2833585 RepID=UPI001BC9E78D|nr:DUF3967 domain-containing protein [Bacillus sp. FJAT-49711]MBS4218710.1 DUF3967 domain-containing protein [Bacillus sp. FJAT-49711]